MARKGDKKGGKKGGADPRKNQRNLNQAVSREAREDPGYAAASEEGKKAIRDRVRAQLHPLYHGRHQGGPAAAPPAPQAFPVAAMPLGVGALGGNGGVVGGFAAVPPHLLSLGWRVEEGDGVEGEGEDDDDDDEDDDDEGDDAEGESEDHAEWLVGELARLARAGEDAGPWFGLLWATYPAGLDDDTIRADIVRRVLERLQ